MAETLWGGCKIYVSTDGTTYKYIGTQTSNSRHGVVKGTLPQASDPDSVNTLSVDLSISRGALLSGTQDDADRLVTACLVGNEIISYQTATLTSQYNYDLTYLRRGQMGSSPETQKEGTRFVRLDDRLFKYVFDPTMLGRKIWIKFQVFNLVGVVAKELSEIDPYTFTLGSAFVEMMRGVDVLTVSK
jgi:hypothetical protein